jgi:predicted nucleic acid-binding protein
MKPVLADTSYYVALLGPNDAHHQLALEWSQRLRGSVVVTEYVLVELGSALSGLEDRHLYVPFAEELLNDPGTVFVPASQPLLRQGLALFAKRPDKAWSLVDCISIVVMKQRRLTEALTIDHHFVQAGFRALLRERGKP